jgi:hypothetical protein
MEFSLVYEHKANLALKFCCRLLISNVMDIYVLEMV